MKSDQPFSQDEILGLLDDQNEDFDFNPPAAVLEKNLLPAAAAVTKSKTTSASLLALQQQANPKIFRNRPSLKELMNEYNKYTPRRSPIKHNAETAALLLSGQTFRSPQVEFIHLETEIPGKILRPKTS